MSLKQTIEKIQAKSNREIFQAIKDDFTSNGILLSVEQIDSYGRDIDMNISRGMFDGVKMYGFYGGATFAIRISQSGYTFYVDGIGTGCMGAEAMVKKLNKNLATVDEKKKLLVKVFNGK